MDQNAEYLWLKQSVTFTVNGQTRTVEIALPLRPGATVDEVEALLSEADAGMERLSRHLDTRVAAIGGAPASTPQPVAPEPARASVQTQPAPQAEPSSLRAAPAARQSAEPASAPQPRPPATSVPARPTAPAARPAPPASAITPAPAPQAARGGTQGDLSRPDFIAAIKDLDLDVRQAMQKLNVRSLEGLNLREALEALRRQSLRGGQAETSAATTTPRTPAPAAARTAPIAEEPPHYFEEEDEPDMTFSVADDEEEEDGLLLDDGAPVAWDDDSDDLDEVPDFGPPTTSRRPAPAKPAPAPLHARTTRGPVSGALAEPIEQAHSAANEATRASQLLARLRAAQGGGSPTSQQRTAYRNIVVREIGEEEAAKLVRGIWRVTPERLGPEQMDELLSWGKQDTFSDDTHLVIAELRAERERAAATSENGATKPAPRPRARPLSAPDPSGGA